MIEQTHYKSVKGAVVEAIRFQMTSMDFETWDEDLLKHMKNLGLVTVYGPTTQNEWLVLRAHLDLDACWKLSFQENWMPDVHFLSNQNQNLGMFNLTTRPANWTPSYSTMTSISLAATGHRPDKLGGYQNEKAHSRLVSLAEAYITRVMDKQEHHLVEIVTGMAQGWDTAWVEAALKVKAERKGGLWIVAAIPFVGQDGLWPEKAREKYHNLLYRVDCRVVLSQKRPDTSGEAARLMQKRNEFMVERCDRVVALHNGDGIKNDLRSGTGNCVKYAMKKNKPVINLWANWQKYAGV